MAFCFEVGRGGRGGPMPEDLRHDQGCYSHFGILLLCGHVLGLVSVTADI